MSKYNTQRNIQIKTAWQYDMRIKAAKDEAATPYWQDLDLDLKKCIVRQIKISEAKPIIEKYEWLGKLSAVNKYAYGIFFKDIKTNLDHCGGVVVFSPEYSENLGVWDKYDFTGKMILLSRGVCLHWAPKNTNSKLIMGAINLLPSQYEVITVTTDHNAGEAGTIYQACNFHYTGSMNDSNPNIRNKGRAKFGVIINGKLYGSRAIRGLVGTQKKEVILKAYPDAQFIKQRNKHRYFYFKVNKKYYLKMIEHLIKPYPKRKRESEDSP